MFNYENKLLSSSFCNLLQLIATSFVLISCSEKGVATDFPTTGFKSTWLYFCALIFRPYHRILGTHSLTQDYTVKRSCLCCYVRSHNFEKQPLVSSCLSVRLYAWNNSAYTGWSFMKFYVWNSVDNIQEKLISDNINGTAHED